MKVTVPEELFRAKKSGVLLPFFGAGVSAALGVPSWKGLLKEISEKISCPDALKERVIALDWDTDFEELSLVASELMKASGDIQVFMNFLQESLKPEISGDMPERFKAVSELRDDLPGLVTTNFDTVLEDYCGFTPNEVVYRNYEDLLKRLQQKKFLFKIHGDPNKSDLIVFTKEQYEKLENDNIYQEVLKQIFLQWAIIFVGYSITDTYILKNLEYLHRNFVDELEVFALLPDAEFELQKHLRRIGVRVIPYTVGTGLSAHSAVDAFLALLDSKDFIPAPESGFQGRIDEINNITRALIEKQAVLIELVGPAGIGKTQLARAAAQNIRQEEGTSGTFGTSIFVDLINKKGSNSLLYGIRDALGLSETITEKEEIFNEVTSRRALIIADNVEDPLKQEEAVKIDFINALVQLCTKLEGNGALIATSRTSFSDEIVSRIKYFDKVVKIDLGPLQYEEARELFILESKSESISEIGEKILRRLSANPGSIRILGRRVAKLSDEGKENLFKNLLEDPEKASRAVLNTTFELLPEDSRSALQIALAFPAGLSPELARFEIGEKFTELLAPALQNGLLLRSGGRYRSMESIRQSISSSEVAEQTLLKAIDFYTNEINLFHNEQNKGVIRPSNATFLLEEYSNISACAKIAEKLDHMKLQRLTSSICIFFNWSGFLEDPTRWIKTVYTSDDIKSHDIGVLLLYAGTLAGVGSPENNTLAEKIYRRILEHYEKQTELSSLSRNRIIQASEYLAMLLMIIGGKKNLVESENLLRKTLAMKKEHLGNSNEELANLAKTTNTLANLLLAFQGEANLREAETLIREAFTINKKLAEIDPRAKFNLAESMLSLAKVLTRLEEPFKITEVEELCSEAVKIHRELATIVPGAKRALVQSLTQYANILALQRKLDRYQEIEEMYREAIKIQKEMVKTQPLMQRSLAFTLYSLAIHLRMGGEANFDEAETLQREALNIFKNIAETMPSALNELAQTLNQLATFIRDFNDKDKLKEAELMLRESLSIANKVEEMGLSASELKIQNSIALAQLLKIIGGQDRLEEAEHLFRQVIGIMRDEAKYSPRAKLSISSINVALAQLIISKGGEENIAEGIALYREAINIQEEAIKKIPQLNANLALTKMNFANFLHNFGQVDLHNEIMSLYQDALKTIKSLVDTDLRLRGPMAYIMVNYANYVANKGGIPNFKAAESLLRDALKLNRELAKEFPAELYRVSETLTSLGAVLRLMGGVENINEAEKYYREALTIRRELMKTSHGLKIDITATTTDLAQILIILGGAQRFAEAENLLRETLDLNRKQVKQNPMAALNLVHTLCILANLLDRINDPTKLREAETIFREALEIYRIWVKTTPVKMGDFALTLMNLSLLLLKQGDPQKIGEAEKLLIEALNIYKENKKSIPEAEINLYKTEIALVDLYIRLGNKEKLLQAESLCREALNNLKERTHIKGMEIPIMDTSYKLASIILSFGGKENYNKAELVLREALAYAKTHVITSAQFQVTFARIEYGLGVVLANSNIKQNLVEAESLLKDASNIQRKFAQTFPEVKGDMLKNSFFLAELYTQLRTKDSLMQAEILYREVLNMFKTDPNLSPDPDSDIVNVNVKLANVLLAIGTMEKVSESEDLLKQSLAIIRKMAETSPEMRINSTIILHNLSRTLESQIKLGKKEKIYEIEPLMDEAIMICKEEVKKKPELKMNLAEFEFFLAANLKMYSPPQKYNKAELLYNEVLNIFREMEQTPDIKGRISKTSSQLAGLLEKMNRIDDAEIVHRRALQIARELADLNPEINEYLGSRAYNLAVFLKTNKESTAKEEILELYQEAKDFYRKAGKENLIKQVQEAEKRNAQ